jgi:hypothetical protein
MANGAFNRGSNNAGRKRDGSRLPGQSASEGNVGNVIPRPTTIASIRRAQSLMNILNDKQSGGNQFSRGTTKGSVRRNFALMAQMSLAAGTGIGVQLTRGSTPAVRDVPVPWTTEVYDYDNWWSSGSTLTCPTTGTYSIGYNINVTYGTGGLSMRLYVNGSIVDSQPFPNIGFTFIEKTNSYALNAGDTIYLQFTADDVATVLGSGTLTIA